MDEIHLDLATFLSPNLRTMDGNSLPGMEDVRKRLAFLELPKAEKSGGESGTALAGIEARLDRLSEQIDVCLEQLCLCVSTPPMTQAARTSFFANVLPSGPAQSSNRLSRSSRKSRVSTPSVSENSNRTTVTVVDTPGPERVTLHTRKTQASARHMDLAIAWRMGSKEEDKDVATKTLSRLVERTRGEVLWEMLDDPRSSHTAWFISQSLKVIVIFSVLWSNVLMLEDQILDSTLAAAVEILIDIVFLVEFACRVLSAPSKRNYFKDPLNWADILSTLALPLRACGFAMEFPPSVAALQFLRYVMPIVRFLKLLRYFESFRLLLDAGRKAAEALPVIVYMTALIVMVSATAIYLAEPRGNIPSMPHALWLALVTMTTVGYGDYYPVSFAGYVTVAILTFISVLFLALPVGIIGYELSKSWQERTQVLLLTRFRKALNKWGYGAQDLRVLINYVDMNGDRQLSFDEFVELVRQMRIGISTEEAALLFGVIDQDQNGLVDHGEFMKSLFPAEYMTFAGLGVNTRRSRARVSAAMDLLAEDTAVPPKEDVDVASFNSEG